ncbi:thioredoxin [Staphylococcus intermedius]|uniref:Thioredoxin n=1 Tax=Staphylococcus intermedius NCTC 11048 TaxID=1141106 RepID=A0A380G9D2_STAIN|nr:thioredoxin [Staphylococcus intermedius]PCF65181.1 thiol reductase thioredoxin [Staphylococcus intermedius]PCF80791.1 thiol reductase thioredoxin [Staphylococcus intermedius]PCF82140.1 thiol reductase thioredoxin [Staphylococcus intermedius]PCF88476.1 thiol reductase thioredoxin [Staphylococcus intermedius]PCF89191.1 thiol reductase thioredoxin [Staphylococcus intermedius]
MAIIEVQDSNFDEQIQSGVKLVDFWATWCGPCKMIAPVLEDLASDYEGKADILKLDVDQNQATAAKFEVMSIPTLIVFKDGQPVDKVVGFQPKENLAQVLDKHL